MSDVNQPTIYVLSGPCGVGKSTVAQELSRRVAPAALVEGDAIMDMLQEGHNRSWDEQLGLAWENIAALTRNFVRRSLNLVVDFVVENELERFCRAVADLPVQIRYVVLVADEATLAERLGQRGDSRLLDRSLFLLKQLTGAIENAGHFCDTTRKEPAEIVTEILTRSEFTVEASRP